MIWNSEEDNDPTRKFAEGKAIIVYDYSYQHQPKSLHPSDDENNFQGSSALKVHPSIHISITQLSLPASSKSPLLISLRGAFILLLKQVLPMNNINH